MAQIEHVYTAGTFDLPHYGHIRLLKKCLALGPTTLILNTDSFVEQYKGKKPILSLEERINFFTELKGLSKNPLHVVTNTYGSSCWKTIQELHEEREGDYRIVIGDDWKNKDYAEQMGVPLEQRELFNSKVIYVPYTQGISSSSIKERVKNA